jgi:hypothetical protein
MIISFDQLIAALIFVLGVAAGLAALLEPLAGITQAIVKYLRKLVAKTQP